MTLLDDVRKIIKNWTARVDGHESDLYDADVVADAVGAVVEEDNMWFGDMRWGSIQGYVLGRNDEYVQVRYYSYSGDADGDGEHEASPVEKEEITTFQWNRIK